MDDLVSGEVDVRPALGLNLKTARRRAARPASASAASSFAGFCGGPFSAVADVGGCGEEFANVVDGDISLGDTLGDDSIILIPVDLAGMSGNIGPAGDFNRFAGCSFHCFTPDCFRLADDEETFCITWEQNLPYAVFSNSATDLQYLIPADCDYSLIRSALHLSFVLPIAIGDGLEKTLLDKRHPPIYPK
ncbi:unnamed protein product [Miscanthus lutarioriparius]|uniref:Uncharacterized protein n=1 Tax=Miscanthus lutarioriparius TaxID=422564 RepID=A0A811QCE9_9POAL|nr:unnamed protein product [Miscanthus lutarioriparius]